MNRAAVLFAALFASSLAIEDSTEVSAEIAIEAALDQFREPKKPASAVCANCRGTGKVGDQTVMYDCPVCSGTGKTECVECQLDR